MSEQTNKTQRKSRAWPKDILAVKRFCKAIEQAGPHARSAAVKYLTDRYLGVKLWDYRLP